MPINLSDYYPVSPDLSNVVLTTGNQAIGGIKNFNTLPRVNNESLVVATGDQIIDGIKTIKNLRIGPTQSTFNQSIDINYFNNNFRLISNTAQNSSIIESAIVQGSGNPGGNDSFWAYRFNVDSNAAILELNNPDAYGDGLGNYPNSFQYFDISVLGTGFNQYFYLDSRSGVMRLTRRPTVNGTGVLLQGEAAGSSLDPFSGNRPITRVPVVGQNYGGTTISGFLNNMFFPFISATMVLNSFPVQEYGTNVLSISFNHTIDPKSEPVNTITNLQYFRNETPITSPTTVVTGTVTSLPITLGVTVDQNFAGLNVRVNVNDNGNPKTISGVNTLFFQPRYYYGVTGLASLDPNQIRNLINSSPTFRPTDPRFLFSPVGQYIYFIYPNETKEGVTAWGNLTSIFDFGSNTENINNFITSPNIPDVIITGANGKTMTYKIYRSASLLTVQPGQQFDLRFRF
jgi:hypothetical protein